MKAGLMAEASLPEIRALTSDTTYHNASKHHEGGAEARLQMAQLSGSVNREVESKLQSPCHHPFRSQRRAWPCQNQGHDV